ncbi:hypothetical protein ACVJBD_006037 [Rhizobium mongolense]
MIAALDKLYRWAVERIMSGSSGRRPGRSNPSFVAEIAPLVRERIRQMGPTPIGRSVQRTVLNLRRFWSFLDAREIALRGLSNITAD